MAEKSAIRDSFKRNSLCVCVCVRACVHVCACMRACMRVCLRVSVILCLRVFSHALYKVSNLKCFLFLIFMFFVLVLLELCIWVFAHCMFFFLSCETLSVSRGTL